jgi:hypothetical protein
MLHLIHNYRLHIRNTTTYNPPSDHILGYISTTTGLKSRSRYIPFLHIFGALECVCNSFAYVAYFVFLIDVWIRAQRAAVASRRTTNLAAHLPILSHPTPDLGLSHPSP